MADVRSMIEPGDVLERLKTGEGQIRGDHKSRMI